MHKSPLNGWKCLHRIASLSIFFLVVGLVTACGGDNGSSPAPETATQERSPTPTAEPFTVTIGNLTDTTGPSSAAQEIINMALDDAVRHYNQGEASRIRLEVISYDTRLEPSRYSVGYEWLMEKGADFLVTGVPGVAEQLQSRVNADEVVLITHPCSKEGLLPPGYAFCPATTYNDDLGYTAMAWTAANDPNFPADRPARVGAAAWNEPYTQAFVGGAEQYAHEHPAEFEWAGAYFTDMSFSWDDQIDALQDCDYVLPPQIMHSFATAYQSEGYSTTFVALEAQMAFINLIDKANAWQAVDNTLFYRTGPWWSDDCEEIRLAKSLLQEYHPDRAEQVMRSGSAYLSVFSYDIAFNALNRMIESGANDYDSRLFREHLESLSIDIDGAEHSFSQTRRTSANYIRPYRLDAARESIVQIDPQWYPITRLP